MSQLKLKLKRFQLMLLFLLSYECSFTLDFLVRDCMEIAYKYSGTWSCDDFNTCCQIRCVIKENKLVNREKTFCKDVKKYLRFFFVNKQEFPASFCECLGFIIFITFLIFNLLKIKDVTPSTKERFMNELKILQIKSNSTLNKI